MQTSRLLSLVKVAILGIAKDTQYFRKVILCWKDRIISAITGRVLDTVFLLFS